MLADKSSFTKEEWTLLLESPMMAGMAITAADPSGLWGLLKESFAGGSALAKVMADPGANPLVKALASDFSTSEARSTARDGLKAKFANSQPADVKTKSIEALRQVSAVLAAKQTLTKRSSPISIYELPRTAAFADRFHFVLSAVEITRDFVRRLRES